MSEGGAEKAEGVEEAIRATCQSGDVARATEMAIRAYGAEVLSFLVARIGDRDVASDVFSTTCEDLWTSLETFEWRCSLRTWMYRLARSAAARWVRRPANRASRRARLSAVTDVVDVVRSRTLEHLRTEVKDQFAELQAELPVEDRTLLILRVDRNLPWNDVAEVLCDEPLEGAALAREAARLRQRFKTVKEKLRARAIEVGLLGDDR